MKIFGSKKKKQEIKNQKTSPETSQIPLYPNLKFNSSITDKLLKSVKETDPNDLIKLINKYTEENDYDNAILMAQKMSIYYGVPGLIQYFNAALRHLQDLKSQGEQIQAMGMAVLIYLNVAQQIYEKDPIAKEKTTEILPEENVNSADYWEKKKNQLIDLADLEGLKEDAELASSEMIETVMSHVPFNTMKKNG